MTQAASFQWKPALRVLNGRCLCLMAGQKVVMLVTGKTLEKAYKKLAKDIQAMLDMLEESPGSGGGPGLTRQECLDHWKAVLDWLKEQAQAEGVKLK